MATVVIQKRRRKDRTSYLVSYYDPRTGRKKHYKTFQKMRDAQRTANDLRTLLDTGKVLEISEKKNKPNLLSFAETSDLLNGEWLARFERGELSPTTFEDYADRLKVVNRVFGNMLLCKILENEVAAYQSSVSSEHSNVTANRNLFIIKQVFKHGLEVRGVLEDCAAEIGYLSEKEHERNRFLLPDELEKLITSCQQLKAGKFYMPAIIYLGAEHGASRQEALSLAWKDIVFEYKDQGLIRFFRTKNGRERTEYLMPRTKKALLAWRTHLSKMRKRKKIVEIKSDRVFCRLDGTPIQRIDTAWRKVRSFAGIADFHFHDLRHTFCSNLLLAGSDLKSVKEMIGHSDLSMTDRYSHLTLGYKQILQKRLAEHYQNPSGVDIG